MPAGAKHVAVCGAGVVGLCCAYYLRRNGHEVTVIERHAAGRDGCSYGNAGLIVPSHLIPLAAPGMVTLGLRWLRDPRSPFYIRPRLDPELLRWGWRFVRAATARQVDRSAPVLRDLSLASRTLYEELADALGPSFGLEKRGLLMLCRTDHALEEEAKVAVRAQQLGVPAQVLARAALAKLDPAVRMDVAGGVHYPLDCHLEPRRLMDSLERHLAQAGVTFLFGTEVLDWAHTAGAVRAAVTRAGEVAADEFVLAGGAWSARLVRGLGIPLALQAGKGYSLTLPNPRQLPQLSSVLVEARIAVTPMGQALRVGGTLELGGLDGSIRPERMEGIVHGFLKYFPEFRAEDLRGLTPWSGLRPCSPDGLPYIGRFKRFRNLTAATGHAMMGVSLGPITGKLVAEIVSGTKPSLGISALSPDR